MNAYELGYEAHDTGKSLKTNPWHAGYQDHHDWRKGWLDAAGAYVASVYRLKHYH